MEFPPTGSVYDSPVTANGNVYINSYFLQLIQAGVFSLNGASGGQIWTQKLSDYPFSPVVFGGNVYFATNNGYLYCFNAYIGAELWNFTTGTILPVPCLAGGYLYAGSGNNFYALNSANGDVVWNQTIVVQTVIKFGASWRFSSLAAESQVACCHQYNGRAERYSVYNRIWKA